MSDPNRAEEGQEQDPRKPEAAEPTLAEGGQKACDELVKKTEKGAGAPYLVVSDLAALKKANRASFETLRARLKQAGCRVTELDKLIAAENDEQRGRDLTQADILLDLAEVADLFHAPDEIAYADLEVDGHRETWPIRSKGFRRWLARRYFEEIGGAPNAEAMAAAINVIEAKALHNSIVRTVHVRVGELSGKIYVDLCDGAWRAVEVDKAGWRILDRPVVRFRRSSDMRALPEPARDGSVEGLRPLLNIGADADDDFVLAIAYELACLRARGPYPVMVVGGEQGTAKTTRSALLSSVVDPRRPILRALPRDERDLFVAARSRHVLGFDNVSGLPIWLSDAICRIASGIGFGTRQLYSDDEEVLFDGARPFILNGIEEIVERPDLAERSLFSNCEPIADENRRCEEEIWEAFDATHASVLGALIDAVSTGLKKEADLRPPNLPRMADFALWAIACEPALWKDGHFLRAYRANIQGAVESVLEASPVSVAVRSLMDRLAAKKWEGTSSDLLTRLTDLVGEKVANSKAWPGNSRALSGRLRRAASFLRRVGINVAFGREGHVRSRQITITADTSAAGTTDAGKFASAPSAPNPEPLFSLEQAAGGADANVGDADANAFGATQATVRINALKQRDQDRADDADAKISESSAAGDGAMPERSAPPSPDASPQKGNGAGCASSASHPVSPNAPQSASVAFMLTQDMRRRLRACGYSDEAIAHLTPQQAHEILSRPNA
jgi:hypothetical protein